MHVYTLQREQLVPLSPVETFDFFADPFNLEAITPPWLGFEVATPRPIAMGAGALIEYRLKLHALPLRWLTRIEAWEPGRRFADRSFAGPTACGITRTRWPNTSGARSCATWC